MGEQPAEPGWYNDPDGVHAHQAYWDGGKWTGETRPDNGRRAWEVMIGLGAFSASSGFFLFLAFATGDANGLNQYTMWGSLLFLGGITLIGAGLVVAALDKWNKR